ncbi:MAG: META domain-containing protein [Alistipes sp.]|nr:META domain-containing protein [Alistipes senegalensis]MCM1249841.1 META domain-containing protein [Alistipes sp.]
MKYPIRILFLSVIVLLAVGCGSANCHCRAYQKKYRRPLTGTAWQLVQLDGRSVQPQEGRFSLVLSADDGRFSGVGSCNRLMGSYETDASRALKFGPVASTRRACPDPAQEGKFVEALEATTHYDMDGPMLLLLSEGELRAVLQAVDE